METWVADADNARAYLLTGQEFRPPFSVVSWSYLVGNSRRSLSLAVGLTTIGKFIPIDILSGSYSLISNGIALLTFAQLSFATSICGYSEISVTLLLNGILDCGELCMKILRHQV
jgi:hypothetical protein